MGRRALRTGDMLVAHAARGWATQPTLYDDPSDNQEWTGYGFSHGVFLAQRRASTGRGEQATFFFVFDSPSCRLGWVVASLVRRMW